MSAKESRFFAGTRLARKLTHSVSRVRPDSPSFPQDVLSQSGLDLQFLQHIGFPESADGVAYEPVQKLLAVSTSDGRVKLIGKHGVEATLLSDSASPTKYLGFLRHRGAILRVTENGTVQLFSVPGRRLLSSVRLDDGDSVNDVAVVPGVPYVILGCQSGNCRVVLVSSRTGTSGGGIDGGVDPAAGLAIQPYQILGEDLDASGGVVAVTVTRNGDRPLALVVHLNSGAAVWDIRAERVVSSAPDAEDDPSKPTCACWVGDRSNCFAVGYDDGSVLVFGVPATALKANLAKVTASQDAVLVMSLRVAPEGTAAAPVRSLTFLQGGPGTPGGEDCLMVCGGQAEADPDMLTMLPLDPEEGIAPRTLPWFGTLKAHALMPRVCGAEGAEGGGDELDALMTLTEGGQLVVHDLREWHPYPLTLPLQELPPVTACKFVPALSEKQAEALTAEHAGGVQHALTLKALCEVAVAAKAGRGGSGGGIGSGEWPFCGGQPAACDPESVGAGCHPSALLLTGHRDGRVRVWNVVAQVPVLLATLPASKAVGRERLRAVTTLDACPASGLLAVGHAGGDVRVFQFSNKAMSVRLASLDESLVPYDAELPQPAGFQYVLKYSTHSADVTSLCLASRLRLLAVGDAAGGASAVDLTAPQRLFQGVPVAGQAVAKLAVGPCATAAQGEPSSEPQIGMRDDIYLFVASENSVLTMVALATGQPVARSLHPKNASRPLDLALLDGHGVPLLSPMGSVVLPWADNNAATAAQRRKAWMTTARSETSGRRLASAVPDHLSQGPAMSQSTADSPEPTPGAAVVEVRSLPSDEDEDLDAELQAAAAEVEAQDGDKPSRASRFGSLFKRRNSPGVDAKAARQQGGATTSRAGSFTAAAGPSGSFTGPSTSQMGAAGQLPDTPASSVFSTSPSPVPRNYIAADAPPRGYDDTALTASAQLGLTPGGDAEEDDVDFMAEDCETETMRPNDDAAGRSKDDFGVDTAADLWGPQRLAATPEVTGFLAQAQEADCDYPFVDCGLSGDAPPAAEYVLMATADYLRVYSAESVRLGDRSTDRKAKLDPPAAFAGVFLSEAGPGVACVSRGADSVLTVHSVPNLAPLMRTGFSCDLGFPWSIAADADEGSSSNAPPPAAACSYDGQLLLTAPGNELVRVGLVKDAMCPPGAASTFDWGLAKAARAASVKAPLPETAGAAARLAGVAEEPAVASPDVASPSSSASGSGKKFLSQVKGAAAAAGGAVLHEFERVRNGVLPPRELPSLRTLFETPVDSLVDPDGGLSSIGLEVAPEPAAEKLAEGGDEGGMVSGAAVAAVAAAGKAKEKAKDLGSAVMQSGAKLKSMLPLGKRPSDEIDPSIAVNNAARERRHELLGTPSSMSGASPEPPTAPVSLSERRARLQRRTASEVKREYGHTRAQDARTVMERNKVMLAERGEKLKSLEKNAEAMRGDAEDFASLAQELEKHFSNRKWWQF